MSCRNLHFLGTYSCILLNFGNKKQEQIFCKRVCHRFKEIGESYEGLDCAHQKKQWFCAASKNLSFMNFYRKKIGSNLIEAKKHFQQLKKPTDQKYLLFKITKKAINV